MQILLIVSVPIFYIWGLVSFIRWLSSRSASNKLGRRKYLETTIAELNAALLKTPKKALSKQLEEYIIELGQLGQEEVVTLSSTEKVPVSAVIFDTEVKTPELKPTAFKEPALEALSINKDWGNLFSNWYSDNSINLLLYLGAFLIVASATIYVGFQWETIGGSVKSLLFTFLTITFFASGAWFYSTPKIKQAGVTFIAIAALLIPFNGLAWYNFVLGPAGYSVGSVWLVTSAVAVVSYAFLAYFIRHPFYTYIAGFGGLSTTLAFVNTTDLNREFYILGGIFSSFVLLLSTRIFSKIDKETLKNYVAPLTISAHVIMPVSLGLGLLIAINGGRLFSFEVVSSAFLTTLYYLVAYSFDRKVGYLYVAMFLLPVSMILAGKWLVYPILQILIPIQLLPFVYLITAETLKSKLPKEYEATSLSAHIIMPFSLFLTAIAAAPSVNFFSGEVVISSLFATAFYALAYYLSKESSLLLVSQLLFAVLTIITGKWLGYYNLSIILALELIALIYIGATHYLKKFVSVDKVTSLAANTVAGFSLIWLLFIATSANSFFTTGVVISAALGSLFYFAGYFIKREVLYLVAGSVLLPITTFLFGKWLDLTTLQAYYLIQGLIVVYLAVSFPLSKLGKNDSESITVVSLAYAAGLFFMVLGQNVDPFHQTLFAALPAVYGLVAVYAQKSSAYLYYNIVFLIIAVFLYFTSVLGLSDKPEFLGSAYLGLTVIFYLLSINTRKFEGASIAFVFGGVVTAALGHFFTLGSPSYFFIGNVIVASIFADYAIRYNNHQLLYVSNTFIALALWTLLRRFDVQVALYPLFFTALSFAFYALAQGVSAKLKQFYRLTALVGTGLNTVVFGLLGQTEGQSYYSTTSGGYTQDQSLLGLERNALISSYATTVLYGLDAFIIRSSSFGYFASAIGMLTYIWQMKYLGFAEVQTYTLPLGVYFMTLAYLQRLAGNVSNRDLLNYVGLFFLFVPTFFQSFGENGAKYALLLGVEGLAVFALGNSLSYRIYTYAGIGAIVIAVISQSYEFVFSLPRWVITATVGLSLIGTAIFLLLRRKEEPPG